MSFRRDDALYWNNPDSLPATKCRGCQLDFSLHDFDEQRLPVQLPCSHYICIRCISATVDRYGPNYQCRVCKETFLMKDENGDMVKPCWGVVDRIKEVGVKLTHQSQVLETTSDGEITKKLFWTYYPSDVDCFKCNSCKEMFSSLVADRLPYSSICGHPLCASCFHKIPDLAGSQGYVECILAKCAAWYYGGHFIDQYLLDLLRNFEEKRPLDGEDYVRYLNHKKTYDIEKTVSEVIMSFEQYEDFTKIRFEKLTTLLQKLKQKSLDNCDRAHYCSPDDCQMLLANSKKDLSDVIEGLNLVEGATGHVIGILEKIINSRCGSAAECLRLNNTSSA